MLDLTLMSEQGKLQTTAAYCTMKSSDLYNCSTYDHIIIVNPPNLQDGMETACI